MKENKEMIKEQFDINDPNSKIVNSSNNINTPVSSDLNENSSNSNQEEKENENTFKFPTAYTIIVILEVIVFLLTYIIPKGRFAKLEYTNKEFKITYPNSTDETIISTQENLNKLGIKITIDNFENGNIKKPIAIPNTYERINDTQTNFLNLFVYPINGLMESADISFFLLIMGGCINILTEMNSFSAGMAALSRVLHGKEFLLLCFVFILVSLGGTCFGMCEEILAFCPILMPIFIKNGIDCLLGVASLYMGSMIGTMFSTINAFAVVIASDSAGINFKDGIAFRLINFIIAELITILYFYRYYRRVKQNETNSIVYEIKKDLEDKYLSEKKKDENNKEENNKNEEFTILQIISLIIFLLAFIFLIIGVLVFGWWFEKMTSAFFVCGIILMFLLRRDEEKSIDVFIKGAGSFCGVALVVGLARGINITLDKGNINDTILNSLSQLVNGLPKIVFVILMLVVYILLGFFIASSSGLAVLSMPVFAPLADNVGIGRNVIVNTYMFGQNYIQIVSPSGLILIVLQLVGIKYNHWIKFIWQYLIILFVYLIIILVINTYIG